MRTSGLILLVLTLAVPVAAADYFTELEIDEIREAQEIDKRVEILLRIAQIRLARLGLVELEEEIDQTQSDNNAVTRAIVRILAPAAADQLENARVETDRADFDNDLSRFSRTELLRGYFQAIEETMDNIDDAFERNRNVRAPLEALEEFTRESIPLLREFNAANEVEQIALEDAIGQAEIALEGAENVLGVLPKTEQDK
jgi:hypothetical protein